jgi:predicted dithiol-disulfide oxidoreductase (DUF899 family)
MSRLLLTRRPRRWRASTFRTSRCEFRCRLARTARKTAALSPAHGVVVSLGVIRRERFQFFDYQASFPAGERENGVFYNFEHQPDPEVDELPGVSAFYKDDGGAIFHTYSTYARGGEMFLSIYAWLDAAPKGRNEPERGSLSEWVKRHDRY